MDLSYPSNRLTFGNLVKTEVPSVLFKYPYTFQQMLFDRVTDSDHRFHFLNELKLWGVQKTKKGIISNLLRYMFFASFICVTDFHQKFGFCIPKIDMGWVTVTLLS